MWSHELGSSLPVPISTKESSDGNIYGCGVSGTSGSPDLWIFKLSRIDGSMIFQNTFGGNLNEFGWDIIETSDGGYLIVGSDESMSAFDPTVDREESIYLIKTGQDGETEE